MYLLMEKDRHAHKKSKEQKQTSHEQPRCILLIWPIYYG